MTNNSHHFVCIDVEFLLLIDGAQEYKVWILLLGLKILQTMILMSSFHTVSIDLYDLLAHWVFVYIEIHKRRENKVDMLRALEELKLLFDLILVGFRLSFRPIINLIGTWSLYGWVKVTPFFFFFSWNISEFFFLCRL